MENKPKNREWVKNVAIIFLSVLLVLTFFSNTIMNHSLPEVATQNVTNGSITARVRGTGTVTAVGTNTVKATETREIRAVMVKVGQSVEAGDVLFVLGQGDITELQAAQEQLRQLQISYQRAAISVPSANYDLDYYNINLAKQQLESAKAYEAEAYRALREVLQNKLSVPVEYLDEVYRELTAATEVLSKLDQEVQPQVEAIEAADEAVAAAQARYDELSEELERRRREEPSGSIFPIGGNVVLTRPSVKAFAHAAAGNEKPAGAEESLTDASNNAALSEPIEQTDIPTGPVSVPDTTWTETPADSSAATEPVVSPMSETPADTGTPTDPTIPETGAPTDPTTPDTGAPTDPTATDTDTPTDPTTTDTDTPTEPTTPSEPVTPDENEIPIEELERMVEEARLELERAKAYRASLDESRIRERDEYAKYVSDLQKRFDAMISAAGSLAQTYRDAVNARKVIEARIAQLQYDLRVKQDADSRAQALGYLDVTDISQQIELARQRVDELSGGEGNQILAKVAGTVLSIECAPGDTVVRDTVLCTIEVPDMGYTLSFSVTNDQARRLKPGDTATISNYYWGREITATLTNIKTDPKNPQNSKIVTFELKGDVTVGSELTLSVGQKSASYDTVVPNSAIRSDTNGKFVLVVQAKSSPLGNRYVARRVAVEVLAEDDLNSAVSGDLAYDDYVITTSNAPVKNGELVRLAD